MRRVVLSVLAVLAVGGGAACAAPSAASDDHAYAREACTHFRNVVGDVASGVLTDGELRAKLVKVRERADIASVSIQSAATAMLAALTAGDSAGLSAAVLEMDAGCRATSN